MNDSRTSTSWRFRRLLVAGLLFAVPACARAAATHSPEPAEPARVLTVGGGSSHDFDQWFYKADSATLRAAGAEVSYTDVPGRVSPALSGVDVLNLTNNQPLPDPELRDEIFNFVNSGKGLMINHPAAWYNWEDWPAYNRNLVGGGTRGHRKYGEFQVTVADADHPVMEGVPSEFTVQDELYWFEPDPAGAPIHVLATATEPETGKVYPVVWSVEHPNGRIIVNTLGHDGAVHNHPAYQAILRNSVRWTSRQVQ